MPRVDRHPVSGVGWVRRGSRSVSRAKRERENGVSHARPPPPSTPQTHNQNLPITLPAASAAARACTAPSAAPIRSRQ